MTAPYLSRYQQRFKRFTTCSRCDKWLGYRGVCMECYITARRIHEVHTASANLDDFVVYRGEPTKVASANHENFWGPRMDFPDKEERIVEYAACVERQEPIKYRRAT